MVPENFWVDARFAYNNGVGRSKGGIVTNCVEVGLCTGMAVVETTTGRLDTAMLGWLDHIVRIVVDILGSDIGTFCLSRMHPVNVSTTHRQSTGQNL